MPSEEQQKAASRKITQWIENEKRVVTYRDISREVGCHVNTAKNILLEHLAAHPSLSAGATYLLSGPLLRTSTLTQTVLRSTNANGGDESPSKSKSLAHLGGTQIIRIRDMDEMSEADRNSEDELEEDGGEGREEGLVGVGNDKGALDEEEVGFGVGVEGRGRKDEVVRNEQVARWGVVLVGQEGLEDKKKLFESDTLTIHIYALSPGPVSDPSQYLVSSLALRDKPNYHDSKTYGTLSGSAAGAGAGSSSSGPHSGGENTMRDGAMDWGKKDAKSSVTVKEEAKKAETKSSGPLAVAAAPSGAASSSATKEKPLKSRAPAAAAAPTQKAASQKKKRVVQSDTDTESDEGGSKTQQSSGGKGGKTNTVEPTSSMVRADDKAAMEAMMSMDMDVNVDVDVSGPERSPEEEEDVKPDLSKMDRQSAAAAPNPKKGGRKRRKVKKSVTELDAKGYMVTKDVWSDESYSGDSEEETKSNIKKPLAKPALKGRESTASLGSGSGNSKEDKKPATSSFNAGAGAKKASGGGGGGARAAGQSTLKGFFTKK